MPFVWVVGPVMLHLDAGAWHVAVDPEHGARVVSLSVDGEEWLSTSSPERDGEGAFVRPGLGGWDEVVPTVADCAVAPWGRLGDHGQAWHAPWEVRRRDAHALATTIELDRPELALLRTLTLGSTGLTVDYELTNRSATAVPWLWTAHMLFAAPAGTSVEVDDAPGSLIGEWPRPGSSVARLPAGIDSLAPGTALKCFARGARQARITRPGGSQLVVSAGGLADPAIGLLWDRRLWAGEDVVAIEPSNAATDRASDLPRSAWLAPRRTTTWRMSIAVVPRTGTLDSRMSWPGDRVVLRDPEERPGSAGQGDG